MASLAPFFTDAQCGQIIAFCEREIPRRRSLARSILDMSQDAMCHLLADVQYAAMHILAGDDDHANLAALIDEADYAPLYAAELLPEDERVVAARAA